MQNYKLYFNKNVTYFNCKAKYNTTNCIMPIYKLIFQKKEKFQRQFFFTESRGKIWVRFSVQNL